MLPDTLRHGKGCAYHGEEETSKVSELFTATIPTYCPYKSEDQKISQGDKKKSFPAKEIVDRNALKCNAYPPNLANPSSASSSRGGTNREEVLIGHCKRAE
jgi:hypothetical protein